MGKQEQTAIELRQDILEQCFRAHVGHIGSALSVADILDVLFQRILQGAGTNNPQRDIFVLGKGHAALALYCALYKKGILDQSDLDTYCADGSLLGVHPEHALRGVEFSTGSLGQGLSLAVGTALGMRIKNSPANVYCLISDAELNEGSLWEAIMFAGHHGLENLTVIVDNNGQQALAPTRDVLNLGDLVAKWDSFGWDAVEIDGHDSEALYTALTKTKRGAPRVVVAKTIAGSGISYMERQVAWHYMPMSKEQYERALNDLGKMRCET